MADQDRATAKAGQDPRAQEPKPPFPKQSQPMPGSEEKMQPQPDYGENTYRGCGKLTGKTALITGADSGIGRAVALAYAREGADITIAYLNEDQDARVTAHAVEEAGRRALKLRGDIGNEEHCKRLVRETLATFGRLDILVNNAAYQKNYTNITEISTEEWDRAFRTNIYAMFFLSRAAVPSMKPGSAIINTASIQAFRPSPNLLPYAATKGAIVDFTKALAKMLIRRGIRVNAVAPGPVWTPLIPSTSGPEGSQDFGKDSSMGRPAQPAELAPVYVLLASDEASYINGELYSVTGGEMPV